MTKCEVEKHDSGYGWNSCSNNGEVCIMAEILDHDVGFLELHNLIGDGQITQLEYNSIVNFDRRVGTDLDLTNIQNIANRFKVRLVGR